MKNAWRPYGYIEMSAPGLKRSIEWGTKNHIDNLNDGLFHLVPVTKQMMAWNSFDKKVNLFESL